MIKITIFHLNLVAVRTYLSRGHLYIVIKIIIYFLQVKSLNLSKKKVKSLVLNKKIKTNKKIVQREQDGS